MNMGKIGAPSAPPKPQDHLMTISRWPTKRCPEGIGLSIKDGWNVGIGFGLAMAIAVPLILLLLGCVIGFGLMMLGGSLGSLL